MTSLQRQFQGFLKTAFLWEKAFIENLLQFEVSISNDSSLNLKLDSIPRLGKLVERFVTEELKNDTTIEILAENIQIQDQKITLGEMDCLLLKNNSPIHLEIVYKFYLYDAAVGVTEIEHWIGPNRRDSLVDKLIKLKEKQLPLLYNEKTKPYLKDLNLSSEEITQQVYFKAQLFVPLVNFGNTFSVINTDCIEGFYIKLKELQQFDTCKFYIPSKHNWLVKPHTQIDWISFNDFTSEVTSICIDGRNPLCWMKKPNGELTKFFIVNWK